MQRAYLSHLNQLLQVKIKEQILRAVEEGKWDSDDKKDEKPKEGQAPKIDTNAIAENTGMKSAQFKGISFN